MSHQHITISNLFGIVRYSNVALALSPLQVFCLEKIRQMKLQRMIRHSPLQLFSYKNMFPHHRAKSVFDVSVGLSSVYIYIQAGHYVNWEEIQRF